MAGAPSTARRRRFWIALAALAIAVVAVGLLLATVLARPAPPIAGRAPMPSATATPAPQPGSGSTATTGDAAQQHEQYRAYMTEVVEGGTAVAAGLIGLEGCRAGRAECANRLADARNQVGG